ncbi:hypothetical protein, partial [Bartonella sp. AC134YNZD]|uniref:hypothetical protein n=1 Tax=Bartonella sp. AC134YNZD TaxID=3243446 RepID=UPI0035CF3F6A
MAFQTNLGNVSGQSTNKPPFFNGTNYTYWRTRMEIYMCAHELDAWKSIFSGYTPPMKDRYPVTTATTSTTSDLVPKTLLELDPNETRDFQANKKAMYAIICAIDSNEYNKISGCDTAKEMWDKLEVMHVGTNLVKESKINMLTREYELFKMEKGGEKMVRKFLRVLPRSWQPKVTALTQTDLKKLSLDELYGSLLTHEMDMKVFEEDEEEDKKKRRAVAFTSVKETSESEESSSSDEDVAMPARRFNKFLKKKGGKKFQKFRNLKEESLKKKDEVIYYECNKPGHIKPNCQKLKKQHFKKKDGKKAMVAATWSDDESS